MNFVRHNKQHPHSKRSSDVGAKEHSSTKTKQAQHRNVPAHPPSPPFTDKPVSPVRSAGSVAAAATSNVNAVLEEPDHNRSLPRYPGLERYKLLEEMGDGAFSVVYQAYDTVDRIKVAVKAIQKQELSNSQVCLTLIQPSFSSPPPKRTALTKL